MDHCSTWNMMVTLFAMPNTAHDKSSAKRVTASRSLEACTQAHMKLI